MEFGVFEMIVMFELFNVLEKSVTLNAMRDWEQPVPGTQR